jgi:glucose-1-phosphate thymidylyltransferase/glucose-1-phosphate adenylyltransferase
MRHPLILMAAGVSSRMKKAFEGDSTIDPVLLEEANTLPKCMLSVGPNRTRFIDYIVWNAVHA